MILQLLLLSIFVTAFTGTAADVPLSELAASVATVLGIPLILAASIRFIAARADAHDRLDQAIERAQPVGLGLLTIAIAAIFANHPAWSPIATTPFSGSKRHSPRSSM